MSIAIFVILAALEILLAVRTCVVRPDKKAWRRDRLVVRAIEVGIIVLCLAFCPQAWRFVPVLLLLAILFVIAAIGMLLRRNKQGGHKKGAGAVAACLLSILAVCLFMMPAFLFTGYSGLPVTGEHEIARTSAILVDSSRTDPFEKDGSYREVPVHFYYPADGTEQYPLVVFSHGAFGYYESNTSTYMELASNGYVVVALDHPHHAFFAENTEGKTVIVDTEFISTALNLGSIEDKQAQLTFYKEWMKLRTGDMNFAVDEIKNAVQAGAADDSWFIKGKEGENIQAALAMTDISRIGLMGHSMGGATSVELGRERDDIAAVIDIDGTMLGEYTGVENGELLVREDSYTVPVLDMCNWKSYNDNQDYIAAGFPYPNVVVIGHAAEGFSLGIRDSEHMDFTDLPMFSPTLGKMLGSGERSTEEIMNIVNSLVLSFYDCYLKGEGAFTAQAVY